MSLSRELIVAAKARADAATEAFNTQILEAAIGGNGAPGRGTSISYVFDLDGGFAVNDFVETAACEDVPMMADALLRVLDLHAPEGVTVLAQSASPGYEGWPLADVVVCSLCLPDHMRERIEDEEADESDVRLFLHPCATVRAVTGDDERSTT